MHAWAWSRLKVDYNRRYWRLIPLTLRYDHVVIGRCIFDVGNVNLEIVEITVVYWMSMNTVISVKINEIARLQLSDLSKWQISDFLLLCFWKDQCWLLLRLRQFYIVHRLIYNNHTSSFFFQTIPFIIYLYFIYINIYIYFAYSYY